MEEKTEFQGMEKAAPEREIDLRAVWSILRKNLILIIVITLLAGIGTYFYSYFFISKQYSASAMMIVNNKSNEKTTYSTTELVAAQDLAEVYHELFSR